MSKTNSKQVLFLIALSFVLTALVLEIGLRLGGFIFLSIQDHRNRAAFQNQQSFRILCLGESTTFMGGEDSYPSQLEEILNRLSPKKNFKVINKGIPGKDTNYILDNVESWITEYQPDIVVAMMGINDPSTEAPFDKKTSQGRFLRFFKDLRIYKLSLWLKQNLALKVNNVPQPPPSPPSLPLSAEKKLMEEEQKPAEVRPPETNAPMVPQREKQGTTHEAVMEKMKDAPRAYHDLYVYGFLSEVRRDYTAAEKIYLKLIEANENDYLTRWMYERLGTCLLDQKRYKELIPVMQRILELSPADIWVNEKLLSLCGQGIASDDIQSMLERLVTLKPEALAFYDFMAACHQDWGHAALAKNYSQKAQALRSKSYRVLTKTNYLKLIQILQGKNIKPVFVQYPLTSVDLLKQMLEEDVDIDQFIFVDNEKTFREALAKGRYNDYFTDRFAGNFGHCTPEGNRILAQNIAQAILHQILKLEINKLLPALHPPHDDKIQASGIK